MGLLGVGLSSRLFVSGGEWSIPHVVTQVPARDIMHLLPFWGLALFSFSSFVLWESEGPWVDTCLLGAHRGYDAITLEDRPREGGPTG